MRKRYLLTMLVFGMILPLVGGQGCNIAALFDHGTGQIILDDEPSLEAEQPVTICPVQEECDACDSCCEACPTCPEETVEERDPPACVGLMPDFAADVPSLALIFDFAEIRAQLGRPFIDSSLLEGQILDAIRFDELGISPSLDVFYDLFESVCVYCKMPELEVVDMKVKSSAKELQEFPVPMDPCQEYLAVYVFDDAYLPSVVTDFLPSFEGPIPPYDYYGYNGGGDPYYARDLLEDYGAIAVGKNLIYDLGTIPGGSPWPELELVIPAAISGYVDASYVKAGLPALIFKALEMNNDLLLAKLNDGDAESLTNAMDFLLKEPGDELYLNLNAVLFDAFANELLNINVEGTFNELKIPEV